MDMVCPEEFNCQQDDRDCNRKEGRAPRQLCWLRSLADRTLISETVFPALLPLEMTPSATGGCESVAALGGQSERE